MKWQLSLAAFSLGHRTVEFVTWFESLIRGCLEHSPENGGPSLASHEVTHFDDSRLRNLEVEIQRILHLLMTADHSDELNASAESAIKVVDRTFILCLRFGQCSLLSSEIHPELEKSLSWLEEFLGEADVKTWRRQSRKVSKIIRGTISEFTSCFAEMGDAFPVDLRCFYQLGRAISEIQVTLPMVPALADTPIKQHLLVREKLYPVLLRLMKNCAEQAPAFPLRLDERINDRDFYHFVFDLQEAIETQLTRLAKQESDRTKAKKTLQASTTGSGATGTPAAGTSTVSDATGEPNRPKTESSRGRGADIEDASKAKPMDNQGVSHSTPDSDSHRQFVDVDRGVKIYGVVVQVEGVLKRVLLKFCHASPSVPAAELKKAVAVRRANRKRPSTQHLVSTRLTTLRNALRAEFRLPKTADPIPRVKKSNPTEWELDWQLLWDAAHK